MPRIGAALFLAVFAAILLTAADPPPVLEWPHGSRSQLPSPDGRHILYGQRSRPGIRQGPEVWLRHPGRPTRKRLLQLGSTARAFWFPDSRHFLVVDRESSSSTTTYVYNAEGRVALDLRAELLSHDPELRAVSRGHLYVEAQRLLDAETMRVAAFGHTDEPPVRCFHLIYTVTRQGAIERLSKRISPVTPGGCEERSD